MENPTINEEQRGKNLFLWGIIPFLGEDKGFLSLQKSGTSESPAPPSRQEPGSW
jgi:hypothetical protein